MSHLSAQRIVELLLAPGAFEANPHVQQCQQCRSAGEAWTRTIEPLSRTQPPGLSEARRAALIDGAISQAAQAESQTPPWIWWLRGGGLAAAGAALALLLWIWAPLGGTPPGGLPDVAQTAFEAPALAQHAPSTPAAGEYTAAEGPMALSWSDGTQVEAERGTRFSVFLGGTRLLLFSGRLKLQVTKRAPGADFVVETPEARVRVVGTRFAVARDDRSGTQVHVDEGVVEVVETSSGSLSRLTAGMSRRVGGSLATAAADELALARESGDPRNARRSARAVQPTKHGKGGNVANGPSAGAGLLEATRAQAQEMTLDAELLLAEAEQYQARGQPEVALGAYLDVARRFPTTASAEDALFAACQLSIAYGGRAYPPRALLDRYLTQYPRGRYRSDALRLLKALTASPK